MGDRTVSNSSRKSGFSVAGNEETRAARARRVAGSFLAVPIVALVAFRGIERETSVHTRYNVRHIFDEQLDSVVQHLDCRSLRL